MQGIKNVYVLYIYIMQEHMNLSKHYVFICKPQTDQWDTNGKVNMTLEKGE